MFAIVVRQLVQIQKYWNSVEYPKQTKAGIKMGTSMSYSSKQKCRIEFRNRAIPRSKIPRELQKYYRYKHELAKNNDRSKAKYNPAFVKGGDNHINLHLQRRQMDEDDFIDLPLDIPSPSIQKHSDLVIPKLPAKSSGDQRSSSSVHTTSYVGVGYAKTEKEFFPVKLQQKYSDVQTQPINKKFKVFSQAKEASVSNLPDLSKNNNQTKMKQKMGSSNKKSNERPSSQSSHALSEIILQREAYYTINYEKFREDIKEQGEECSMDIKDRRLSEKIYGYDHLKTKYSQKDQIKNDLATQKVQVLVCTQAIRKDGKQLISSSQQTCSVKSKGNKKQSQLIKQQQTEKTFKAKPFNIVLQLNSNIDEPLFSTSLRPTTPINISHLSKNVPTNYSNNSNNSDNLSTNSRARKLIYF